MSSPIPQEFEVGNPNDTYTPPVPYQRNPVTIATHEQAKPLLKVLRRMLMPRHPRTKQWTKPKAPRRTKHKQPQYD